MFHTKYSPVTRWRLHIPNGSTVPGIRADALGTVIWPCGIPHPEKGLLPLSTHPLGGAPIKAHARETKIITKAKLAFRANSFFDRTNNGV